MDRELLVDVLTLLQFVEVEFSHELDLDTGECPEACRACHTIAQSPMWSRWLSHSEIPLQDVIMRLKLLLKD